MRVRLLPLFLLFMLLFCSCGSKPPEQEEHPTEENSNTSVLIPDSAETDNDIGILEQTGSGLPESTDEEITEVDPEKADEVTADNGSEYQGYSAAGQNTARSTEEIKASYYSELVALEGYFQGQLAALAAQAKAEYHALPVEGKTDDAIIQIQSSKMDQAAALESQCDAKVEAVLGRMKNELAANGGDFSAVNEFRKIYLSEKNRMIGYYQGQM